MKYIADLHTHSTASDGQYAPAELVRLAKERGLEVFALTDHDTLDGLDEAAGAGEALGLQVVRGVELSADEYPNLHILGYGFSQEAPGLREKCEEFKHGRENRKYCIQEFLQSKGVYVPLAEVDAEAAGGIVGRPHFARVMLRHGCADTWKEVFDRYLDTEEFHIFDGRKPPVRECIEAIRMAGGTASLAHPYQTGLDGERLESLLQVLIGYGLEAVECFYPKYTKEQASFYLHLAEKYGLRVTGGSDFHGEQVKADVKMAAWELDLDWLLKGRRGES